jgi:hypothetical protein
MVILDKIAGDVINLIIHVKAANVAAQYSTTQRPYPYLQLSVRHPMGRYTLNVSPRKLSKSQRKAPDSIMQHRPVVLGFY